MATTPTVYTDKLQCPGCLASGVTLTATGGKVVLTHSCGHRATLGAVDLLPPGSALAQAIAVA